MMPAFLIPFLPVLYRWLAIAALVAAFGAYCGFKGYALGELKYQEAKVAALAEGVRIGKARDRVTTVIETKYLPQIVKQQVVTETIMKEVPVYVSPADPDLRPGFRVLHDAAAAGRIPDPARIPDAAPVPAQAAAGTVAENYGICRADQLKLQGLQEWVTQQGKVR